MLRNRHGERFVPLYDPVNGDRTTRDVMSQAIFLEVQKGHGVGGVGEESLDALRSEPRRAMWNEAGIVRTEASLRAALASVRECAAGLERCPAPTLAQAGRREETRLMLLAAEAVVISALARRETRGAHRREDFPSQGGRWLGSHRVRLAGGGLQAEFVPKHARTED